MLFVAANDGWRYGMRQKVLNDATYELARWAAENADTLSRDQAASRLAQMGAARGITVYQYGQTDQNVQVWTQTNVTGTIIAGTFSSLMQGKSFDQARSAPFIIRDYREAGIQ